MFLVFLASFILGIAVGATALIFLTINEITK